MKKIFLTTVAFLCGIVCAHATILLWHPDLGNAPTGHTYVSSDAQTYEIYSTGGVEPAGDTEGIRNLFNQQLLAANITWLTVRDIRSDADTQFTVVLSISENTTTFTRTVFFGYDNNRCLELTQRGRDDAGVRPGIKEVFFIFPGMMETIPLTGSNEGVKYNLIRYGEDGNQTIATIVGTGGPISFSNIYLEPGEYWIDNVRESWFTVKYWDQFNAVLGTTDIGGNLSANGEEYRVYFDYFIDDKGNRIVPNTEDDLFYFESIISEFDAGNSIYWDPQLSILFKYDYERNKSYICIRCSPNLSTEEIRGNTFLKNLNGEYIQFVQTDSGEIETKTVVYSVSGSKLHAAISSSQYRVTYQLLKDGRLVASTTGTGGDCTLQCNIETGDYHVVASYGTESVTLNGASVIGSDIVEMSAGRNWIVSTTFAGENRAVSDAVYYDGLGYPRQTVALKAAAPEGTSSYGDLVQQVEYDMWHREIKSYLPAFVQNNNGSYMTDFMNRQDQFYKRKFNQDVKYSLGAYTFCLYENSPLNRKWYDYSIPGHIGEEDRKKQFAYDYNAANRVIRFDAANSDSVTVSGYYSQDELFCNEVIDQDSLRSVTYTDKTGRLLLQTNYTDTSDAADETSTDTYYVYDDLDRLVWVISPEGAVQLAPGTTFRADSDFARKYCYVYTYDMRGRVAAKQLPGCAPVYMVYDCGDRLVMEQDGNMRAESKWRVYKYDDLGRLSTEHFIVSTDSRDTHQASFDQYPQNPPAYSISEGRTLIARYAYDTPAVPASLQFADVSGVTTDTAGRTLRDTRTKGLKTSEEIGIIRFDDSWRYLQRAYYYDYRGRVIQTVEQDPYGGLLRTSMLYDFSGNLLKRHEQFTGISGNVTFNDVFVTQYTYDNRGRMTKETATLNGKQSAQVEYRYDELGRLTRKRYGTGSNAFDEAIDYNIQGWITRKSSPLFDFALHYYDPGHGTARYSGNIAEVEWKHKKLNGDNDGTLHTYAFDYDRLNRLNATAHYENGNAVETYRETDYRYDRNGNISGFLRTDEAARVNNYSFIFNGNQRINEKAGLRYRYDQNGNLTEDPENYLNIFYNFLNLPKEVYPMNNEVSYRTSYLADGTKYSTGEYENNGITFRGSLVYMHYNETLARCEGAMFGGGYFSNAGTRYYLTDHLGSNRVVVNASTGQALERNDYYPFGKRWRVSQYPVSNDNNYRFNGKEDLTGNDFPYLDYGGRVYDPNTGAWSGTDPLAENYYPTSPYAYCLNNPVRYIDPDGRDIWEMDHNGEVKWIGESREHTLYALNKDGGRTGQSITISDRSIFDGLAATGEKSNYKVSYTGGAPTELASVFLFGADNSDVEWRFSRYDAGGGDQYAIGTAHIDDLAISPDQMGFARENEIASVHSHPGEFRSVTGPKSEHGSMGWMPGPMGVIRSGDSYNVANKTDIYPGNKNLYVYVPYSGNIHHVRGDQAPALIRNIKGHNYNGRRLFWGTLNER